MDSAQILKPQDVALLVKLLTKTDESWRQIDVALELGLSQGEIAKSLVRLKKARLVNGKRPIRAAALEFLIHAIKYVFPTEPGPISIGISTAISSPAHHKMVVQNAEEYFVWPSALGRERGQAIAPFYAKLPEAALKDKEFYSLMSAIEILRTGRARERKLAERFIQKKVESYGSSPRNN